MIARPGGVADALHDSHLAPEVATVAYRDGEIAGFTMGILFRDSAGVPFSFLRLAVGERHRRQGVGSALLARAAERLEARQPVREILLGAWLPNEAAERFAEHHGLLYSRTYWLMERPLGGMAEPAWPGGVTMRTFDGTRAMAEDLNAVYNDSFSAHDHFAPSSIEETINVTEGDLFRPDGVAIAYRSGQVAGFCHCKIYPGRGEISTIGTAKRARGIGLGRALLRWGVRWLETHGAPRVTLSVDGENENALRLYRQEGFDVAATRRRWTMPGRRGA